MQVLGIVIFLKSKGENKMTNEIAVKEKGKMQEVTKEKLIQYLKDFGLTNSLETNEINQFMEIAITFQLNPFKREIYCIPFKMKDGQRKLSIITGYETYLKRAERLGTLNGWEVSTQGSIKGGDLKAIVIINRKDWENPLKHEVYFVEYNQNNHIWNTKPITMIKKVAIAQAFRLAFPDEFGGMPYTADELPENMTNVKVEIEKPTIKPPPIATIPASEDKEKASAVGLINEKQGKRMYAIWKSAGLADSQALEIIKSYGFTGTKDVTIETYDVICEALKLAEKGDAQE